MPLTSTPSEKHRPPPAKSQWRRRGVLVLVVGVPVVMIAGAAAFGFEGQQLLDLYAHWSDWILAYPVAAGFAFALFYALAVAVSIPGASWLTILAGALFGPWLGSLLVGIAATVGAMVVFFLAAHGGRGDWVQRAGPWMSKTERAIRQNAISSLLFLRLVPVFPFWLVNIIPALVGVSLPVYVLTTFFGILPATVIYAVIGHRLKGLITSGDPVLAVMVSDWTLWLPLVGLGCLVLLPSLAARLWRKGEVPYG